MKTAFLKYSLVFMALILSATSLVYISQTVQQNELDISLYDQKIAQEKEKIRILKAEWAYLNNPARLEVLATGGYSLKVPDAGSMVSDSEQLYSLFTPQTKYLSSIAPATGTQAQSDLSLHPQGVYSNQEGGLE